MSSKVELLKGGTPYRRRLDWRRAQARIRPSLKIPELNQSKHSASLCFSTRTCRPAEIKRARLATCRLERTDPVSEPDDNRLSRNGSLSGRQADAAATHVCTVLPCAAIQPRTGPILWWEFLGFTRDRI